MPERMTEDDWCALLPELSIGAGGEVKEIPFDPDQLSPLSRSLWEKGYIAVPPVFSEDELRPLRQGMLRLSEATIPPVYIYLYDEPWQLFARLGEMLRHFLGEEYAILPNLWAWHLSKAGETGWPLHRDCNAETVFGEGEDAILMSLSLWLPLTDVDESNGCMYVQPKNERTETPLPAKAGSVLGWRQDLYHRGGTYGDNARNPRMSLSFEFQNCAFDPLAEPLIDPRRLPDFLQRLNIIQAQFAKYRHIDPALA